MSKEEKVFVADTSVIIEGELSNLIKKGEVKGKVIIHKAVVAEIEHQVNYGREKGKRGLNELNNLNELVNQGKISVSYEGSRPNDSQIRRAKSGEIDAMIRDFAWEKKAVLITGDKTQGEMAKAMGMEVILLHIESSLDKKLKIEKYFDDKTMSIHLKEDVVPYVKKGRPGEFEFVPLDDKKLTKEKMKELADEILVKSLFFSDTFIEIERKYSTIVQYADIRIVITRPPFSDGIEITAVRPLVKLEIGDYKINENIIKRFEEKAEGILIAGSPGAGKTTFARALANFYESRGKIVKTVESPRDLDLKPEITQYSKNFGSSSEIHDILLLSRPDYTIFDEVRDTKDFNLYSDLRLSGIGLVGVIHSTSAIDAIQRFIGRLELGIIPSVLDTVIFINNGEISQVLELVMTVKVPTGMIEADLSRPVIEVRDFLTKAVLYEMYSYGEETVVIPLTKEIKSKSAGVSRIAEGAIKKKILGEVPKNSFAEVEVLNDNSVVIHTNDRGARQLIGSGGKNVQRLESELGVRIDVRTDKEEEQTARSIKGEEVGFIFREDNNYYYCEFKSKMKGRAVSFFDNDEFVFDAIVGKKGIIRVSKKGELGSDIEKILDSGNKLRAFS